MRVPHRNFVVEIKNGRRRPQVEPKSIWGNTDFKALAREVQVVAPQLFESKETADQDGQNGKNPPSAHGGFSLEVTNPFAAVEPVASEVVEPPFDKGIELPPSVTPAPKAIGEPERTQRRSIGSSQTPVRRTADQNTLKPAEDVECPVEGYGNLVANVISNEELADLEAENARLKRQLADQLRLENARLRSMLHRFLAENGA